MKRIFLLLLLIMFAVSGCATTVQLGSIPRPPETSKLRVAVIPISGMLQKGHWGVEREEFEANQYKATRMILSRLGYYDVVSEAEMKAVIGEYVPDRWLMTRNDAEQARKIGTALYADYVLLAERGTTGEPNFYLELTLINIESGRRFSVRINSTRRPGEKRLPDGTRKTAFRELFRDAKADLLATALRKTRGGLSLEAEQQKIRQEAEKQRAAAEQLAQLRRSAEQVAIKKAELLRHRFDVAARERAEAEKSVRIAAMAELANAREQARKKAEEQRLLQERIEAEQKAAELAAHERAEAEQKLQMAQAEAKRQIEEADRLKMAAQREQERREQERLARIKADEEQLARSGLVSSAREVEYTAAEQQENRQINGAKRLIVYDLAATTENQRPVAIILSEALREEIQKRGVYNLVNRENLQQMLNEMKFQQSGMVESSQALQLGKGAGAQEIVTGNIGTLGRTVVLQSKRTDIQSMLNLSLASIKSEAGQEDLLLARLAEMVDQLMKQQKLK